MGVVVASFIGDDVDDVDAPPWMVSGGTLAGGKPMFDAERRGAGAGTIGVGRFQEENPPGHSATERVRREGGEAPPMAIIWPYPSSPSSYVSAGQQVVVPPQRCPTCLRQLAGWGG